MCRLNIFSLFSFKINWRKMSNWKRYGRIKDRTAVHDINKKIRNNFYKIESNYKITRKKRFHYSNYMIQKLWPA